MKVLHINSYYRENSFYKHFYTQQQEDERIDLDVYAPVATTVTPEHQDNVDGFAKIRAVNSKYDRIIFSYKHHKILQDIRTAVDVSSYDLMQANTLFSNGYVAYKMNKEHGVPYIVCVRDTDLNFFFKKLPHLRNLGIRIVNNASAVVFLSNAYREQLISQYLPEAIQESVRNKSVVIPNGVNPFWMENRVTEEKKPADDTIRLIFAGAVSKRKNPSTTALASEELIRRGYEVKFTIVGRVDDEAEFKKIQQYDFIEYHKPVPHEELIQFYRQNDIFCMPSLTETFGLTYAEAMTQGLPVLYSQNQGFDEQFPNGTVGYAVKSLDPVDIADHILKVRNNYEEISSNASRYCSKFKWENIHENYMKLYESILAGQTN